MVLRVRIALPIFTKVVMLPNFLIGLREGLEAALIVGILIAYVHKIERKDVVPRIWLGVGLAVGLSLAVGAALAFGTSGLEERTEEILSGVLSIVAAAFVTWMIFWMVRAARGLSAELRQGVDTNLAGSGWGLVAVAFLAVVREGVETALFLWASIRSGGSGTLPVLGAVLGILGAAGLGYLIYRGALKLNLDKFFRYTGIFLIVIAAGVLTYGVHELQEAGILPEGSIAFDVTGAIPPDSWWGVLLKGTFSFSPVMTWLEVAVWIAYVVPVMIFFVRATRRTPVAPAGAN
jgi:high-affinity iron transporter